MENTLTFTIERARTLYVQSFENYTSGSGMTEPFSVSTEETPEDIYKRVLDLENKERKISKSTQHHRNVIYCYWVTEYEILTDDRSKFGHENKSSSKEVEVITPNTYVRGEVLTLGEALAKSLNNIINSHAKKRLSSFISLDLKFDKEKLTDKELNLKIIMIPGEHDRETFFDKFYETSQIKVFPENELLSLNFIESVS